MNNAVVAQLRHIVVTYGVEVCEDARRVEGLLRDLAGEHRREIAVLVGAVREGLPSELLVSRDGVPPAVLEERLVRVLEDNLGMAADAARWSVAAWAVALDVAGFSPPVATGRIQPDARAVADGGGPGRSQPEPVAGPAQAELVVALLGPADHRTIKAAVAAAEPGTRIMVRPGIYREPLVLDRPVELLADGPVDDVVVEATDGSCLLMQADYAVVRGFTLRGRAGTTGPF
ncbi:MAG TPA: hypothetical protein VNF47_25755 [Streptosporangiaceae bacterium]|nr:hypothetical protein [Streptosporangiaceae bacterium]